MLDDYTPIAIVIVFAVAFATGGLGLARFLSSLRPPGARATVYECGVRPMRDARDRVPIKFYVVAMLFIGAITVAAPPARAAAVQQAYVKASNTRAAHVFGVSLAVSGDTMVVGAPHEGSNATGVNGDQDDNNAPDSGAAYVFVRDGTNWTQQAYLKASNTESNDFFG